MTVTSGAFSGCCGINILSNFGWSKNTPTASGERDLDQMEKELTYFCSQKYVGLRLIALSKEQIPYVEHLLEKFNFVPLIEGFYHPGHGTQLSLYGEVVIPDKSTITIGGKYGKVKRVKPKVGGMAKKQEIETRIQEAPPLNYTWIEPIVPTPIRTATLVRPRTSIPRATRPFWER